MEVLQTAEVSVGGVNSPLIEAGPSGTSGAPA
jgi:hypothetical protein